MIEQWFALDSTSTADGFDRQELARSGLSMSLGN
jgi:hypothetical protein